MDVPNLSNAIKFVDPNNQEVFFFYRDACYKQFIENPEQFAAANEEEGEET